LVGIENYEELKDEDEVEVDADSGVVIKQTV